MDVANIRIFLQLFLFGTSLFCVGCGKLAEKSTQATVFPETKSACAATAVPNQFIVRWKDGSTSVETAKDRAAFIQEIIEPYLDDIEIAEHDQIISINRPTSTNRPGPSGRPSSSIKHSASVEINSADLSLPATDWGQTIVNAPAAWSEGVTGEGITVAIIDSGVDTTHPQIQPRLLINRDEIPANEIDDDHNGYVDDVTGYDFDKRTGLVTDGSGHGTHVSGIILADHSTGLVKGLAPGASLLPLDFMDDSGTGSLGVAIEAMHYAASRGARIINASWGGAPCSLTLQKEIQDLATHGILFVSAAGNDGVNIEAAPEYPASFGLENQLTVGASTERDYMAGYSNFSYRLVNIMAPGSSIFSTYPGGLTKIMSGTSMSAPFVSGAAALVWSVRPNATYSQVRDALLNSVDKGNYAVSSGGRLNVAQAIIEIKRTVSQ
jgi:subtilisin family serine protease